MVAEFFQISDVKLKSIWVKKFDLSISTHAPEQTSPQGSYHHPLDRRKLPISSRMRFLRIYFPIRKVGGRKVVLSKQFQKSRKIERGVAFAVT